MKMKMKESDMATVRFSKELKYDIIANARKLFEKQQVTAQENRPSHEWGDKIYNAFWNAGSFKDIDDCHRS